MLSSWPRFLSASCSEGQRALGLNSIYLRSGGGGRLAQNVRNKNLWLRAVKTPVPTGSLSHLQPAAVSNSRVGSKTLAQGNPGVAGMIQKSRRRQSWPEAYVGSSLTPHPLGQETEIWSCGITGNFNFISHIKHLWFLRIVWASPNSIMFIK